MREVCIFCSGEEPHYVPDEGIIFVCSVCTQIFINSSQEHLKKAYEKAEKLNRKEAMEFLSHYIEEDQNGKGNECSMDRKRTNRAARTSNNKIRAQHSAR